MCEHVGICVCASTGEQETDGNSLLVLAVWPN